MHFAITNFQNKTQRFNNLLEQSLLEVGQLLENKMPVRGMSHSKL